MNEIEIKQELAYELVNEFVNKALSNSKNTEEFTQLLYTIDDELLRDCYCLYGETYDRETMLGYELYNVRFICEKKDEYYNSKKYTVKAGDLLVDHFGYNIIKPDGFYKVSDEFIDKAIASGDIENIKYKGFNVYKSNKDIEVRLFSISTEDKESFDAWSGERYKLSYKQLKEIIKL